MTTLLWLVPAVAVWAAAVYFFWKVGAWLPYYIAGSAGSALFIVVFARNVLPLETALRAATANTVNLISGAVGVHTTVQRVDLGDLLVVGVPHHQEWTRLSIGLECSGLLEAAVLVGLVSFFPANGFRKRVGLLMVALVATFVANVIRMLVIVGAVGFAGQDALNFAHVVLGRVTFFALAIGIYWFVITKPTLKTVGQRLRESP